MHKRQFQSAFPEDEEDEHFAHEGHPLLEDEAEVDEREEEEIDAEEQMVVDYLASRQQEKAIEKSGTCSYIFTKGANKGNRCTIKAMNGETCSRHKKRTKSSTPTKETPPPKKKRRREINLDVEIEEEKDEEPDPVPIVEEEEDVVQKFLLQPTLTPEQIDAILTYIETKFSVNLSSTKMLYCNELMSKQFSSIVKKFVMIPFGKYPTSFTIVLTTLCLILDNMPKTSRMNPSATRR